MMNIDSDAATGPGPGNHGPTGQRPPETLFHAAAWREAVEQAFDLKIERFVPPSEPGGVAYYSLLDDIRGRRVVATPFSDFCDPLLTTEQGWREFAARLRSFDAPVTVRPFIHRHALADDSFEHRCQLVWHGIDLSAGADAVWDGLKSKVRTAIRRAAKQGLTFRVSTSMDDIAVFHRMHVDLRKSKYRMLAQPLSFLEELHGRFGDDMAVILAEEDGDPVAAMVYLAFNGVWYYKFSASYPRHYRPNGALIIEACREGDRRGLHLLDMGRSDLDQAGLVDFKEQFASTSRRLSTLHWRPEHHTDPIGADVGRTLGDITELLTDPDVPNDVAARAGDRLYRYFG
jgi:hypothetical protein